MFRKKKKIRELEKENRILREELKIFLRQLLDAKARIEYLENKEKKEWTLDPKHTRKYL